MRDPTEPRTPATAVPASREELQATLARINDRVATAQQARAQALADAGVTAADLEGLETAPVDAAPVAPRYGRGRSAVRLIEQAQLSLFDLERRGRFVQLPLRPGAEFPSLLARLPLFMPGKRLTQRRLLDRENAIPFSTPWGSGRKFGPPLTVYDEDTLIAIGLLRQKRLIGQGAKMPIPVSDFERGYDSQVHVLFTTLTEIETLLGNSKNGQSFELRMDSIRRLTNTRIEFETVSDRALQRGTSVSLLDVLWERWEQESILYIQFTPVMARWFDSAFTYIDWTVRRQLSDTGKAVHRFLSSQPKVYEISVEKLKITIAYPRETKYFLRDLRESLGRLKDLRWLKTFELIGNGRKHPYKLRVER